MGRQQPQRGNGGFTRTRPPKSQVFQQAVMTPDAVKAERCRRSLYHFMHEFWAEVSNDQPRWNWHIEHLCGELEELARRVAAWQPREHDLVINVPPGTTKTITCSIMFPVWCWLRWEWMRFITASYSGALSLESAEYSRDLVRSDKFQRVFPELRIKQDKDTKSNFRVQRAEFDAAGRVIAWRSGGNRFSTSVGGTVAGFHGHIIIVDDPLNPYEAVSAAELRNANRWMDHTVPVRKVDKAVTPMVLIMQRLHQDDPSGHLMDKRQGRKIRHVCLPGEIVHFEDEVNPLELRKRYQDGLLDPVRMNWAVMDDLEADLGQYGYAGQVGQRPTPPGGGMFEVDHFQKISVMPNPVNIVQSVRYWDNAGTPGAGAYTVGVKMHRLVNGKYIIEDVKRGQWASNERERIKRETAEADGHGVAVWNEQEPGSGGKEQAEATVRNLAGFSVRADRPTGDKVFRADPYSVQVNNGNVLLLEASWNHDFIEEHRFAPFGTHKDQWDAAAGAFSKLSAKRQARSLRSARRRR